MSVVDSLVSYWKLDEASGNRADAHGSNTLTDNGTVDSAAGKINNAADFDSTVPEYFNVASNTDLDLDATNGITIVGWFKATNHDSDRRVFGKLDGSDNLCYQGHYDSGDNKFYFQVRNTSDTKYDVATAALTENTMYLLACSYDAVTNKPQVSVNAAAWTAGGTALSGTERTGSGTFLMGAGQAALTRPHLGLIDEIGKWDRVLTQAELVIIYNGGDGLAYPWGVSVAGVFVSSGTVSKAIKITSGYAGVLTMTGTVAKKAKRALDGVVAFAGTVVAKAKKAIVGTITFSGTSVLMKLRKFFARFHDYFLTAPQKFAISSNAISATARYRDYRVTAPKREGYG